MNCVNIRMQGATIKKTALLRFLMEDKYKGSIRTCSGNYACSLCNCERQNLRS